MHRKDDCDAADNEFVKGSLGAPKVQVNESLIKWSQCRPKQHSSDCNQHGNHQESNLIGTSNGLSLVEERIFAVVVVVAAVLVFGFGIGVDPTTLRCDRKVPR